MFEPARDGARDDGEIGFCGNGKISTGLVGTVEAEEDMASFGANTDTKSISW